MPKLSPNNVQVFDGKVTLYTRSRSPFWQVNFCMKGIWFRVSTHTKSLTEAKEIADEQYLAARYRAKQNLAPITKRFRAVALSVRARLAAQLKERTAKVVYADYIRVIDGYLIPFFGNHNVDSVTPGLLAEFCEWRREQVAERYNQKAKNQTAALLAAGEEPAKQRALSASTLNTHNAALRLVFERALQEGLVLAHQVPELSNDGERGQKRPGFELDEYRKLYRYMRTWCLAGKAGKSQQMRHLLRDYVLVLANSGIRHGTESLRLRWRNIEWFEKDGVRYLKMYVCGKTGKPRWCVPRHSVVRYLRRIQERAEDFKGLSLDEVIGKREELVFRLADGSATSSLHQTFEQLLTEAELLRDPRTGQNRTLYSLRHFYATRMLMRNHINIHALARQMGTSTQMLEQFYSDFVSTLTPEHFAGGELSELTLAVSATKRAAKGKPNVGAEVSLA